MKTSRPLAAFVVLCLCVAAFAQGPSNSWNGVHNFSSPAATQQRLTQADLVAKGESDYYSGLGKTVVINNVFSSYSVGSINQNTTTVSIVGEGNNVTVNNEGFNSGNLNGSINWTDIKDSRVNGEVR